MRNKYIFVIVMLLCISLVSAGLTVAYTRNSGSVKESENKDDTITVVTSFYPMYIIAENLTDGIDNIKLENLSEPQTGCLHDFTLTPEDMKLLSNADVFIVNGGGIENFMTEVAEAYPQLTIVEACQGVELLGDINTHDAKEDSHDTDVDVHDAKEDSHDTDAHAHSHISSENAHAWMSIPLYRQQVASITSQLLDAIPTYATVIEQNSKSYDSKLQELLTSQQKVIELAQESNIVIFHEAFEYVANDYDLQVCGVMDLDEERQISAGEVAEIVEAINENDVSFILAEELYGADMGRTIENETAAKVIYIDPLNRGVYDKDSYIDGMQKNIDLLYQAFQSK